MSTQVNFRVQLNTIHHSAAVEVAESDLGWAILAAIWAELALKPEFQDKFSVTVHSPEVVSLF